MPRTRRCEVEALVATLDRTEQKQLRAMLSRVVLDAGVLPSEAG